MLSDCELSTLLCNANGAHEGIGRSTKKCSVPTCHHISHTNSSQVPASSPWYFPHEHSPPRPTFLSARPSSENLPCAQEKRRRWGVLQYKSSMQSRSSTPLKEFFFFSVTKSNHHFIWKEVFFFEDDVDSLGISIKCTDVGYYNERISKQLLTCTCLDQLHILGFFIFPFIS